MLVSWSTQLPSSIYNVLKDIQYLTWSFLKEDVDRWVNKWLKCQKLKRTTKWTYVNTPFIDTAVLPWDTTYVDLLGTFKVVYKTTYDTNIKKYVSTLSAVDSATYSPGIIYIAYKYIADIRSIFKIIPPSDTQGLPYYSMIIEYILQVGNFKYYGRIILLKSFLILWKSHFGNYPLNYGDMVFKANAVCLCWKE